MSLSRALDRVVASENKNLKGLPSDMLAGMEVSILAPLPLNVLDFGPVTTIDTSEDIPF